MTTRYCLSISVRSMLQWTSADTRQNMKNITDDQGNHYRDVHSFRNALMDELVAGHELIKCNRNCDKHDWKLGCQGHEEPDAA